MTRPPAEGRPEGEALPERRRAQCAEGRAALTAGRGVLVTGVAGIGTSFLASRIAAGFAAAQRRGVRRFAGSAALAAVPYAVVAPLLSTGRDPHPVALIGAVHAELSRPGAPAVVLVDAAHLVDPASAAVLVQAAAHAEVPLVLAAPDAAALPGDFASAWSSGALLRLDLEPLRAEDCGVVLTREHGGLWSSSALARLQEASGGIPAILVELARDARESGQLRLDDEYWCLDRSWRPAGPRTVDLITARAAMLPPAVRRVMETVAVLGRVPLSLARVLCAPADLDAAIATRLLVLADAPLGGAGEPLLGFVSMLAADAVVLPLSPAERRAIVERIRCTLEPARLGGDARIRVALTGLSAGVEVAHSELAACMTAARAQREYSYAVTLADALLARSADPMSAGGREAQYVRAECLHRLGLLEQARHSLNALVDLGDPRAAIMAAVSARAAGADLATIDALLDLGPEHDPEVLRDAESVRVSLHLRAGDLAVLERAAEIVHSAARSRAADWLVLVDWAIVLSMRGEGRRAADVLWQWARAPEWSRLPAREQAAFVHALGVTQLASGRPAVEFTALLGELRGVWQYESHAHAQLGLGLYRIETGEVREALDNLQQSLLLLAEHDPDGSAALVAAAAAHCAVLLRDDALARRLTERAHAARPRGAAWFDVVVRRFLVVPTMHLDGPEIGRRFGAEAIRDAQALGFDGIELRVLHDLWRWRHPVDEVRFVELAERSDVPWLRAVAEHIAAPVRPAGLVDRTVAALVEAERHLFAAEIVAEHAGERARSNDRVQAATLFERANHLAAHLGPVSSPRLARARVTDPALTTREAQIAQLAADGLTNGEIASEVYLSARTVEGHLHRIYAKLGIVDRRQLMT